MNYVSTIAMAVVMLFVSQGEAVAQKIKGSKEIVTKTIDLDLTGVTAVEAHRSVEIEIVDKDNTDVVVSANDNLMDFVDIRVSGQTLVATLSDALGSASRVKIKVLIPYNELYNTFAVSSGSDIISSQYMRMPTLDIETKSAGKVKIDATVDNDCTIISESSSKVDLSLKIAGNCYVSALSSSSVRMGVSANQLHIEASGSSKVDVDGNVEYLIVRTASSASYDGEFLKAQNGDLNATSSSKIVYFGVNNFVTNTASSGTITNTKFLNE
ncbi:MAG: DUF2807 domain-containing protein [Rikenellaceae bacterium]